MASQGIFDLAKRATSRVLGAGRLERLQAAFRGASAVDAMALEQQAAHAWSRGEAADAERDWRTLAAAQPQNPDWPIKLAFSAELQGDHLAAEKIVNDAWTRGNHTPELAERITFFSRTNRLSNSALDEAIAIVRDPDALDMTVLRAACYLISEGQLDVGREGLARTPNEPRYHGMLRSYRVSLDILTAAEADGRAPISGALSPARDMVMVHTPGADTTVIVFTTIRGDCGVTVNALNALLQPCGVNAIYLFDDRKQFNLGGNTTLGRPYDKMLEALRAQIDEWGSKTLITIGFSAGGFVALRTGLELRAHGALLFSPVVSLHRRAERPIEKAFGNPEDDARMMVTEKYLRRTVPDMMTRLSEELPDRDCLETIEIHYGRNLPDLLHVNAVWTVPGVDFHELENFTQHECLSEILRRGDLDIFARFIDRVRAKGPREVSV